MTHFELIQRFSNPLPGEKAHLEFLPMRGSSKQAISDGAPFRESAVAIVLFHSDSTLQSIVIQRQEYEGTHSGQISFPGGKKEATDSSLLHTALRECEEEIGLKLEASALLGKLSPVYIPVSQFLIEPYVFYSEMNPAALRPQEREVKAIIQLDLMELFSPNAIVHKDISYQNGLKLKDIPHFKQGETHIWGATALLLNELKYLLFAL